MAPAFWRTDGWLARALAPLTPITRRITARRVAGPGWTAPVPVICCGNVTVGGAGKTTLAIDLMRRLADAGRSPHALLRGHGGTETGPRRVLPDDPADRVGDEALLLAATGPTWIGADRSASARLAVAAGAGILVMDDGLQNPTLRKTLSLLVIDGESGFGNARLLPAGPLREDIATGAARCAAAILIGPDRANALARLPPTLPVLRARLIQDPAIRALAGQHLTAFAGIARPEKFFTPLRDAGAILGHAIAFPDHHRFTDRDLDRLAATGLPLVTTPKDAVRLPASFRARVTVIGVSLAWDDPAALDALLASARVP